MGQSNSRLEKKREAARKKKEKRAQRAQSSIRTTRLQKKKSKASGKHNKKAPDIDLNAEQPAPSSPPPPPPRKASLRYSASPQPRMQPPVVHPLGVPPPGQTTPYVPPSLSPPLSPPLPQQQQQQLWLQQQQMGGMPAANSHVYSQGLSRTGSVVKQQQQQTGVTQPGSLSLGYRRGSTSALVDRNPVVPDAKALPQRGTDATAAATAAAAAVQPPSANTMRTSSRSNLRRHSSVRLNLEESVVLNDGMVALPNGVTTVTAAEAVTASNRATPKLGLATARTSSILKRRVLPSRAQPRREPPTTPTQDIDVIMRQGPQAGRNGRADDGAEQQRRRVPSATGAAMTRSLSLSTGSDALSSYKFAPDKNSNDDANNKDKVYLRTTVSAPPSAAVTHAPGTVYCCTTLVVYEMPLRVRARAAGGGGGANARGRGNTASPDTDDTSSFAVQTYGDDCTLIKTTVPTTGDVLSYKVHELLAHTSGAVLPSSLVMRKAQRMLLAGYSVALLALDAATLTARSEALQTPSFAAVQLLITDTLAAVQAVRDGARGGHGNTGRALNDKDSRNARNGSAKPSSTAGAKGAALVDDDDAAEAAVVADAQPTSAELYVSIVLLQQPQQQQQQQRRQSSLSGNKSDANAALCVDLLSTGDTDSEDDRVRDGRSGTRSRRNSSVSIIDGESSRNKSSAAQAVPKATRLAYSASSVAGLCGARIEGVRYRRIDDVRSFRMACIDARINAAAYTESAAPAHTLPRHGGMQTARPQASGDNNSSGSYGGDGANAHATPSLYVVTCVLVQSRGEAATLHKLADVQASGGAATDTPIRLAASASNGGDDDDDVGDDDDGQRQQQHSCNGDEDDNMLWQPPPPFVARNARGRATRAVDDLVISSLTCVCTDAAPWLATTLAHDIDSSSSGSDSGSGSHRSSNSSGSSSSRSMGSSIAAYLHTLFGGVAHGSVVLGLDPRDVNAYTSLDVQARLAAPLRRRAPRGSLRCCTRRLRRRDVASPDNVTSSDHSSNSSNGSSSRGRADAALSSRVAMQALVCAVTSGSMMRYLSSSNSSSNSN